MAIAFRNATTAESGTTVAVTNNVPTGTLDGDLLLWIFSDTATTSTLTAPTGFTLLVNKLGTQSEIAIWYRVASAEPASYSTPATASGRHIGIMAGFSGVDNVNPFDVATPAIVAGTTAVACPAITPVTTGSWVLGVAYGLVASGVINTTVSSANLTAVDSQVTSTNGANTNVVEGVGHIAWTSGAFTPTFTTSNATTRTLGSSIALRPAFLPELVMATPRAY